MAGHRRLLADGTRQPRRCDARPERWRDQLQAAPTGEAQLATAYDWFRATAARSADRQALMHQAATFLAGLAAGTEGRAA